MNSGIPWYSMNRDLEAVDHGPVDLPQALSVIDSYFGKLRPSYTSGEDAIAETMFGFARAKDDFIEFCINGTAEVSAKVELPRPGRGGFLAKLRGPLAFETTLTSRDSVARWVEQYFTLATDELQDKVAQKVL